MKKMTAVFCAVLACAVAGGGFAASADETEAPGSGKMVRSMPSPVLASMLAGKTFDARVTGYGWGDDVDSISLDFTVTEPLTFSAEEIESLETGDIIDLGMDSCTVASVGNEGGTIKVVPEEDWLSPVTFTANENGGYTAEDENGMMTTDSFSFPSRLGADLVYVDAEGQSLTAEGLLDDLEESVLDVDEATPKITFDEAGYIVELNFSS